VRRATEKLASEHMAPKRTSERTASKRASERIKSQGKGEWTLKERKLPRIVSLGCFLTCTPQRDVHLTEPEVKGN
jgi:hypothetical protein